MFGGGAMRQLLPGRPRCSYLLRRLYSTLNRQPSTQETSPSLSRKPACSLTQTDSR